MKKKILLVLLIVAILLGTGVVYAYFATDAFKSDKELFLSYILTDNMFSNIQDENLTEYIKKQENTAYTNKGEMSATVNEGDGLEATEESIEMLNKSSLTFEGKTDNIKKMVEQKITVDFSQGFNIPINYKRDGDTFGIQSNFLDSKYIAIRNENLKELLEKFDIESDEIPDKIEISQEQFTQEEIKILKEKYVEILSDNLEEDIFSKEKVNGETVVTLKLPEQKCIDILSKILETARDDEILLDKMTGIYKKDEIQEEIDEIIDELKEIETSESNVVEIKMHIEAKSIKKLEIAMVEDDITSILVVIEKDTNQITMKMYEESTLIGELNILKETSGNDVAYKMRAIIDSEEGKAEVSLNFQYKNLLALDNVEENYEIKISYEEASVETTEIKVNYKNLKTFSSNVEIDGLNDNNAIILNDVTNEELQNLIMSIYQNFGLME